MNPNRPIIIHQAAEWKVDAQDLVGNDLQCCIRIKWGMEHIALMLLENVTAADFQGTELGKATADFAFRYLQRRNYL